MKEIRISNEKLPELLGRIGEAIGKGQGLIIKGDETRVYTEIPGEAKKILECHAIEVNQEESMEFSEEEIDMMDEPVYCEKLDDWSDRYYCENLCLLKCNNKK